MKNLILSFLSFFVFGATSQAQITLEQVYPDARESLFMVNLEISGPKYVFKSEEENNRFLKFYNLDHSLWKTIDCNSFPQMTSPSGAIVDVFSALYISETLFDCDDSIEFLYISSSGIDKFTGIYKEDLTELLAVDDAAPTVRSSVPQQHRPIYNTPDGAKLILSSNDGSASVYELPCSLSLGIDLRPLEDELGAMAIYPNPAINGTTIEYELPKDNDEAKIVITDMLGQEIKSYQVDSNFSNLIISKNEIPPGTYIYSLVTEGKLIESKKIIIQE